MAGMAVALGAGWLASPRAIYRSRPEPVNFSHKIHTDKAGTKCEDCHSFRDDGTFAGVPTVDKCAGCHAAPMGTTAAEKSFIDNHVTPNREPQWASYARQPENVSFSHAAHVKRAGLACAVCHGNTGTSDGLRPYRIDRISGYSADIWRIPNTPHGMKMTDCVNCHRQHGQENSCLDCHK
ncbi:MAG TPA: menaquinone reductase multiheme cytochrome c subunit QrcA [Bryobacteraceae bacterium]|nr:menaquinone reductase multiheme cytochrome c subunit QrcA [Bryobacteraceae bacterium]